MDISNWDLLIFGLINICTCTISGISGGGGGFINTPVLIALGLSPASAVSTGKLTGLALAIGSLHGFRRVAGHMKREIIIVMVLGLIVGLISPLIITNLDSGVYRRLIGVVLLALVPFMIWKNKIRKAGRQQKVRKPIGYFFLTLSLGLQGVFNSGLGTLINVSLMTFLGKTATEASVLKRYSQLVLNVAIVAGVLGSALINWRLAAVGIVTGFAGGMIGSRIALKKGEELVSTLLIVLMFLSGLWLLFA